MTGFVESLVLGAVQGIAEWLPISSQGISSLVHLHLFHGSAAEAVKSAVWLHTGTLFAALLYFRKDVVELWRHLPRYLKDSAAADEEKSRLITFLLISTLLTGVVGAPLFVFGLSQAMIHASLLTAVIGLLLIITGVVQRYALRSSGTKTTLTARDAILLGIVQAFAVFPGLSRSGLTVSVFLFRGYHARQAMRVSFLMSIPVVLVAEVGLGLVEGVTFTLPSLSAILAAFVFGTLTIGMLLKIAGRIAFWKFCICLGCLSLLSLLIWPHFSG